MRTAYIDVNVVSVRLFGGGLLTSHMLADGQKERRVFIVGGLHFIWSLEYQM